MIDALYQKSILKQAALAVGHGALENAILHYTLHNPLCGDRITVYLNAEQDIIHDFRHETRACVLCQASASLLGQHLAGEPSARLREVCAILMAGLEENTLDSVSWPAEKWRDFSMFAPVAPHKNRHTCVTLPLQAILKALDSTSLAARKARETTG
tara:strand:- start:12665 stop:13132 length:468 start_codon:yes stop_codon:yes gene_type:complete